MTHGWPGSIVEFAEVAGPLTDPRAHGGGPADAFHLVLPSIPGFGLSGPTRETGWEFRRVAAAFAELMKRLGYERYGVQGGDWGAAVSRELGRTRPDRVIGVHLNLLPNSDATQEPSVDDLAPLSPAERKRTRTRTLASPDPVTRSLAERACPSPKWRDPWKNTSENTGRDLPGHHRSDHSSSAS
jgi:pimeloyl-ACP methyl ester carboxylesterase